MESEPLISRNLRILYGVKKIPGDTCMRERLDQIDPQQLRRSFKQIFSHLQCGKALEPYRYLDGHYILLLDGTGQLSAEKIHCQQCCSKQHRNGKTSYYHHMLGGAIVHPDHKVVIPLAPEPILCLFADFLRKTARIHSTKEQETSRFCILFRHFNQNRRIFTVRVSWRELLRNHQYSTIFRARETN